MAYLDWTENLSVGIEQIDEQHKKLIEIINDLHAAIDAGQGDTALEDILSRLLDYTNYHFSAEEKLMEEYQFPGVKAHKKQHSDLTADVRQIIKQTDTGGPGASVLVLTFLKEWLVNHILKTDMAFGAYLQGKGVR